MRFSDSALIFVAAISCMLASCSSSESADDTEDSPATSANRATTTSLSSTDATSSTTSMSGPQPLPTIVYDDGTATEFVDLDLAHMGLAEVAETPTGVAASINEDGSLTTIVMYSESKVRTCVDATVDEPTAPDGWILPLCGWGEDGPERGELPERDCFVANRDGLRPGSAAENELLAQPVICTDYSTAVVERYRDGVATGECVFRGSSSEFIEC